MSCCSYSNNDERLGHKGLTLQGKNGNGHCETNKTELLKKILDDLEDLNSGPHCAELSTTSTKPFFPSKLG